MARYAHTSDAKGRIFIPAKLRDSLGRNVVVTKSLDQGYLAVYTEEQFDLVREQILNLAGTDPKARLMRREIVGEAIYCTMDGQGRISISDELWSEIEVSAGDDVYVIDMGSGLEICGKRFFEEQKQKETALTDLDLSQYDVKGVF